MSAVIPKRRPKRPGGSAPLQIRLLGRLEVLRDGQPLALPSSKKTRALFAYLIAAQGPHTRAQLCEWLWESTDDPRAALRWSLTKLRPLVDDPLATRLVSNHQEAMFEPHGADIDIIAVRADVGAGPATADSDALKRAAARFRGEFLEGLDLPDCYRYHEWWTAERESIRTVRITILSELVRRVRQTPETALTYARAQLVADPFSEAAHISVIELLGRLGRRREALQQYESCRRMLEGQLGATPSEALEHARAALGGPIGSERPSRAESSHRATPAGAAAPTRPLFGRETERKQIAAILAAAAAGRNHQVLWVTGEPGIGKTRLLEEVASQVRGAGGTVLAGRAYQAEMVRPYGAWIDAIRSSALTLTDPVLRADLAPLVPELGVPPTGGDRNRLFDAVRGLLAGAGSALAPLVLVLDDVQWFDEASAGLLHFAARKLTGSRQLIACAARSSEINDNAAVVGLMRALERDGHLLHLALEPLDVSAIRELVRAVDPHVDANRVAAESEGNALFAIEMTRALARGDAPISEPIEQLIADRLVRLGERAQDLVPWASAIGKSFTPEILRLVSGLTPAELLGAMDELERRGVIRPSPSVAAAYDFTHDLIRQVAYRQLSRPRRRIVHLQLARTMSTLPDPESALAGEIVHHAGLAGDAELAARAAVAAGERSLRMFAYAEAYSLAERGGRYLHDVAGDARIRLQMALLAVAVHASVGVPNARDLDSDISRAIIEAQDAGLAPDVATGFYLLSFRHHVSGNYAAAHDETLRAAEAGRAADPATAARTLANTGRCLALLEREIPRAEALLNEAETLASRAGIDLKDLPWGLGLVRAFHGNHDESIRLLESALALARREQDHWAECQCLQRAALVELERSRPEGARPYIQQLTVVAHKMGEGSEAPFAEALKQLVALALGEPGAGERVERALAALRDIDAKALLARALTIAATLDLSRGRLDDAEARAREAHRAADIVGHVSESVMALAVLARVALMRGDEPTAARHAEAATTHLSGPYAVSAYARRMLQGAVPTAPARTGS